jgi:alpha-glucosidase
VDPIFGNIEDIKELIGNAHKRDIRIMVDLVPNHTSDEHEWFRQSRQSKDGEYADWYIWKDPAGLDKNGNPLLPNNWIDVLTGETAWEWEPSRQQFYLHSFDVKQPDLNWTNPEVREAIKEVMRFWLDLGVDGFRVDAVQFMAKDPLFRDEPKNPNYNPKNDSKYGLLLHPNNHGWPQIYAYLSEMAAVLKEPKYLISPRFMVLESYPDTHEPVEEYLGYYESIDPLVAAPFNFEGLDLGLPWRADSWRDFLTKFHKSLDDHSNLCVASYAFGNHDRSRIVSRVGEEVARSMAVLLLTLPGMVFIYNGEEIGMKDGDIPKNMIQDPCARGGSGRDPQRTPMQWSAGTNAGFSRAKSTWLPVAKGYETSNVDYQLKQDDSFLSLYKKLGSLRNQNPAIKYGSFSIIDTGNKHVVGFIRQYKEDKIKVLINFSGESQKVAAKVADGERVLSSVGYGQQNGKDSQLLAPNEALVIKL